MISAYTGTQIREAEQPLSWQAGAAGAVLMQRAAYGLANAVVRELAAARHPPLRRERRGAGRQGQQRRRRAVRRRLAGRPAACVRRRCSPPGKPTPTAWLPLERPAAASVRSPTTTPAELAAAAASADVVIDAVLGTGAQGGLRGAAASLDRQAPDCDARGFVVACDIPSGVDADTGEAHAPVLPADMTVTFGGRQGRTAGRSRRGLCRARAGHPHRHRRADLPWPALRRLEAADLAAAAAHARSGARTSTPAGCWALWPARSLSRRRGAGLPGRPGRRRGHGAVPRAARRSPTWSARPARRWCAAPAAVADTHVQAWLVGSGLDDGRRGAAAARARRRRFGPAGRRRRRRAAGPAATCWPRRWC